MKSDKNNNISNQEMILKKNKNFTSKEKEIYEKYLKLQMLMPVDTWNQKKSYNFWYNLMQLSMIMLVN